MFQALSLHGCTWFFMPLAYFYWLLGMFSAYPSRTEMILKRCCSEMIKLWPHTVQDLRLFVSCLCYIQLQRLWLTFTIFITVLALLTVFLAIICIVTVVIAYRSINAIKIVCIDDTFFCHNSKLFNPCREVTFVCSRWWRCCLRLQVLYFISSRYSYGYGLFYVYQPSFLLQFITTCSSSFIRYTERFEKNMKARNNKKPVLKTSTRKIVARF